MFTLYPRILVVYDENEVASVRVSATVDIASSTYHYLWDIKKKFTYSEFTHILFNNRTLVHSLVEELLSQLARDILKDSENAALFQ